MKTENIENLIYILIDTIAYKQTKKEETLKIYEILSGLQYYIERVLNDMELNYYHTEYENKFNEMFKEVKFPRVNYKED